MKSTQYNACVALKVAVRSSKEKKSIKNSH